MLNEQDWKQVQSLGISREEVQRQLTLFQNPPGFMELDRAATAGDGIWVLHEDEVENCLELYDQGLSQNRFMKFVPASGAASRMFKDLQQLKGSETQLSQEAKEIIDHFDRFAFCQALSEQLQKNGYQLRDLLKKKTYTTIVNHLLNPVGLDYAHLPKACIFFHQYEDRPRTAFEEQLVEAMGHIQGNDRVCRLHFTVSTEHMDRFRELAAECVQAWSEKTGVSFEISFSLQKENTHTIAVDLNNQPFRLDDGTLFFRPGGHGALIENLNDLKADLVFIKNIDNVVPDRLRDETLLWKRVLGGLILKLEKEIFVHVERLTRKLDKKSVQAAKKFVTSQKLFSLPTDVEKSSTEDLGKWLLNRLNRPLRVCGMVRNEGEPGGGPFWVRGRDGGTTLQIVESAQIDPNSKEQQDILRRSTHFNPVDLVCGVRDWQNKPFDLHDFMDQEAVFIAEKSQEGRSLKALERPGLWNGAMSEWISIFVEVPITTFAPVKKITDLLRPSHQSWDC